MRVDLFLEDSPHGFDFFKHLQCIKSDDILCVIPEEVQLDGRWDVYLFAIFKWFILIH